MGASSSVDTSDKEIVIVGGGYGGGLLATKLVKENVGKVTLIEPREGMLNNVASLRVVVDESFLNKLIVPYISKLETNHIKSKAVSLDVKDKTVTLENGDKVKYTDLVIATGTSNPFPGKLGLDNPVLSNEEIFQRYNELRTEVKAAKRIVMIGGGAVGVEMAGEIRTDFPEKEVTIVNARDFLISDKGNSTFNKALFEKVKKKKIELVLGDRVANMDELTLNKHQDDQIVKTASGKEISCDMVIPCTGTKVNNSFFKDELADAINEFGALQVDDYLRVKGHENVFAIGDVNDVPEEKMAFTAKLQAVVVLSTLKGKPKKHSSEPFGMFVPLGRDGGVGLFKGINFGDFVVKKLKSKDLFAPSVWEDMGQKYPK